MKKQNKSIVATILLIGLCVCYSSCNHQQEKTHPQYKTLTISVYASSEIIPEDYYLVYPSASGVIEKWNVEVGDEVKKGQVIAQLKNDNPKLQLESAELSTQLASEKYYGKSSLLSSIKTEIEATQLQLEQDSINYLRQSRLWEQNIGKGVDHEVAKLKYSLTKSQLLSLQQKLNQTQIELNNTFLQSQNKVKSAKEQSGDFEIRSVIDGKVYDIKNLQGELANTSQPVAAIGKPDAFIIEMWVDERDISSIKTGQSLFVSLDAHPNQVFEGKITKIYPEKNSKNQSFKLEGEFIQKPVQLFSGLTGEANIVISQRKALTIPQSFLVNDSTVLTNEGERFVRLGDRNISDVEIISGLDTNSTLILPVKE